MLGHGALGEFALGEFGVAAAVVGLPSGSGRRVKLTERDVWSRTLTKKNWREIQALLAAEAAAKEKAKSLELEARLALEEAAEATEEAAEAIRLSEGWSANVGKLQRALKSANQAKE